MNAFGRLQYGIRSERGHEDETFFLLYLVLYLGDRGTGRSSYFTRTYQYCTVLYCTLAVGKRDGLKYSTVLDRTSETTVRLLVVVNTTVL